MPKPLVMSEADHIGIEERSLDPSLDSSALIASLRTAGVDKFDPVRLHYIEALAKRASAHQGSAKRMLDARLSHALAALQERFDQARSAAKETIDQTAAQYPHAVDDLQRHFNAGDFKRLTQFAATLKSAEQGASLGALVRQLEQLTP
ncbi:MAG: DUF2894 domain-containing protein, partial [Burkholderiaceae bacterium]